MTDDAPEGLASTFLMLRRAYPQGLPNADYMPLLLAIGEEMSERQLATAIAFRIAIRTISGRSAKRLSGCAVATEAVIRGSCASAIASSPVWVR